MRMVLPLWAANARCRLPGLRTFLRDGQALLARSRSSRQAIALAVFDVAEVVHDPSLPADLVARYTRAVIDCLRSVAGPVGLLARTAPAEFSLLLPLATERMARRMVADEFARLDARIGRVDIHLARPTCAVFSVAGGDTPLAEWQHECRLEVQELAQCSRRLAEAEQERDTGPATMAMEACNGALVAVEVDPMEWIRANELPTTIHAPLAHA